MEKINVSARANKMYLEFQYDEETLEFMKKNINFRKFNKKTSKSGPYWDVAYTVNNVNFILNNNDIFELDLKSEFALKNLKSKFDNNKDLKVPCVDYGELSLPLKNYQKQAVDYIISNNGALVVDDMGLGKSIETLAAIEYLNKHNGNVKPTLIICPKTLKYNWANEIKKWFNDKTIYMVTANIKNLDKFDHEYMIINYDLVAKMVENILNIKFNSLIVDESQYIKNRDTKRTKDVLEIAKHIPFKILLSGTPMPNSPIELLTQLDCLDRMKYIGTNYEFIERYCAPKITQWGTDVRGSSNSEELNDVLKSVCMIRRTKQQVAKELPPKQKINIPVEITNREEYDRAETEFLQWLKCKVKEDLIKEGMMELAAEHIAIKKMIKAKYAEFLVKMEKMKQLSVIGKLDSFYEWLDMFIETGNKIYVSAIHKDIQKKIYERYSYLSEHIFSEDSEQVRDCAITSIRENPKKKILVASLKCTKEGLNLQFIHDFAFLELDWVPSTHEQAEARGHRIGQTETVNCYYFTGVNTVDEKIWELINYKQNVIDHILEPNVIEEIVSDMLGKTK